MLDESGVGLLKVEFVPVMGDNYIRLIVQLPQFTYKETIVLPVPFKSLVIGKGASMHLAVTEPFISEAENIPRRLNVD